MSSPARRRRLEVEQIGDVTVVNFVDRKILDEQNIQIIGEQLFGLVDEEGLSQDAAELRQRRIPVQRRPGQADHAEQEAADGRGRLILCNIDPQIHEVFEITKLDKFFKIMKEEQAALQAF